MLARNILKTCKRCFSVSQTLQSVPGNKPPTMADHPAGRYAGSLFSAASKQQSIHYVLQDLQHLEAVIRQSPDFRSFLKNSAIKRNQQKNVFNSFVEDTYSELTRSLLYTLIDAGRLPELQKIIEYYTNYCKILNKQEDIRVISAKPLNDVQCQRIVASIKKNKPDVKFKVSYEVDPIIMGGLQIYAGTEFLDCSLRSRMEKLKVELSRIF